MVGHTQQGQADQAHHSFEGNGEVRGPVVQEKQVGLMGGVEGSLEVSDYGFMVVTVCPVVFFSRNYYMLKCYQRENPTAGLIPD